MKERVTQSDIARAAGVHNTTVSLSLRNSQLIPAATRERIQGIARTLGYTPDPALRALAAYRNARGQRTRRETLVYLTRGGHRWNGRPALTTDPHATGVARHAAELGFTFRQICLDEPGMNPRRLDRMLVHEGIRCVILAPGLPVTELLKTLDWSRLSAIAIGRGAAFAAELNQVTLDAAGIVRLACRHIVLAGYRRIGLVLPRHEEVCTDRAWSAAFHAECYRLSLTTRPPVLALPDPAANDATAFLAAWHREHRPEVILSLDPGVRHLVRRSELGVPADVAYVDLALQDVLGTIAGVRTGDQRLGEIAVDLLATQLEKNQFGLPAIPTVTSVSGRWQDGASLPLQPPAVDSLPLPAPIVTDNLVA